MFLRNVGKPLQRKLWNSLKIHNRLIPIKFSYSSVKENKTDRATSTHSCDTRTNTAIVLSQHSVLSPHLTMNPYGLRIITFSCNTISLCRRLQLTDGDNTQATFVRPPLSGQPIQAMFVSQVSPLFVSSVSTCCRQDICNTSAPTQFMDLTF